MKIQKMKTEIGRREFLLASASTAALAGTNFLGCGSEDLLNVGTREREGVLPTPARMAPGPLLYAPAAGGISCNLVAEARRNGLGMEICRANDNRWIPVRADAVGRDVIEWHASGLCAGTRYNYRIREYDRTVPVREFFSGRFSTRAEAGTDFTFDIIADSHIFVRDFSEEEMIEHPLEDAPALFAPVVASFYRYWKEEAIEKLTRIAGNIASDEPDFVIHLGDLMDFHGFGHNPPSPDSMWTRKGYLDYRKHLGSLAQNTAHVFTIGNWEGENGWFTPEEIERSRSQRLLYMPTPRQETYAEGGGPNRDYHAFQWGDALFVVLNVMSYTTEDHPWKTVEKGADTWTLGADQLAWLEATLKASFSKWKFIFIHHPVGGNGGNAQESVYGRGGGKAARIGEQKIVHQWMRDYGVQFFFYGHDHVFYDMVVDGIHYTLPGSAGSPDAWKFSTSATGYHPTSYQTESGHARVNVSPARVTVQFVNQEGRVIHEINAA